MTKQKLKGQHRERRSDKPSARISTLKSKCHWAFNSFMFGCCQPKKPDKGSGGIKKRLQGEKEHVLLTA